MLPPSHFALLWRIGINVVEVSEVDRIFCFTKTDQLSGFNNGDSGVDSVSEACVTEDIEQLAAAWLHMTKLDLKNWSALRGFASEI